MICRANKLFLFMSHSVFFFFKQKTAYEMRISDWSSDVCSSDLAHAAQARARRAALGLRNLRGVETMPVILDAQDQQHRRVLDDDARTACGAMANDVGQIGRASCRERVCQYV